MSAATRERPHGPALKLHQMLLMAAAVTAVAAVVAAVAVVRGDGVGTRPADAAARTFMSRDVKGNGRVSRVDQGGDTVSEGQAYAMLLAVADRDGARFARVWTWTRRHLRRPNGLLAWHWDDGHVVGRGSAADADLDAAWALVLASRRFGSSRYRAEGRALAHAILEHETVSLDGRSLLVAGDWATTFPAVVDPSYYAPAAYAALGRASGEARWRQLQETSHEVVAQLTDRYTGLAPDWAVVESDGTAKPTPPPGEGGEAVFGYDAVRVPLWQAGSCNRRDRALAARSATFFDEALGTEPAAIYSLKGEPRGGPPGAPMLVAAAAASAAAGDAGAARRWLAGAEADVEAEPTYYGGALLALARATLEPKGGLAC